MAVICVLLTIISIICTSVVTTNAAYIPNPVGGEITPYSYVHSKETNINSTDYTKIEKSGNYARSNTVKVEYLADMTGSGRTVKYIIIEHMAFGSDVENVLILQEGEADSITLKHTGNNFTVKAKFSSSNSGTGKIKTRISLFRN